VFSPLVPTERGLREEEEGEVLLKRWELMKLVLESFGDEERGLVCI